MTAKTTEEKKSSKPRRARLRKAAVAAATAAAVAESDEDVASSDQHNVSARRVVRHDDADAFIPEPESIHRRVPDDLAEYLGEGFVKAATSGDDLDADENDTVQPEEIGGPFIETEAGIEFGGENDAADAGTTGSFKTPSTGPSSDSEWEGPTLAEAFPTAVRADLDPARTIEAARLGGGASPEDEEEQEQQDEQQREDPRS